jgi:hypothetical protein
VHLIENDGSSIQSPASDQSRTAIRDGCDDDIFRVRQGIAARKYDGMIGTFTTNGVVAPVNCLASMARVLDNPARISTINSNGGEA